MIYRYKRVLSATGEYMNEPGTNFDGMSTLLHTGYIAIEFYTDSPRNYMPDRHHHNWCKAVFKDKGIDTKISIVDSNYVRVSLVVIDNEQGMYFLPSIDFLE